jgi:hypothetical protein
VPGLERQRVRGRTVGDHADDLGVDAEEVADREVGADAGAEPHRHVDHVQVPGLRLQLSRTGCDPGDQVTVERRHRDKTTLIGERHRMLERFLEVPAVHHQLGAEASHRGVLVGAVALGNDDGHGQIVYPTGVRDRLAMVAPRGRHQTGDPAP